jgi:Holliday junction resolvase RusA-like endonuclease
MTHDLLHSLSDTSLGIYLVRAYLSSGTGTKIPQSVHLVIHGTVVPYVRMTQRSKWCDPQAIRYSNWIVLARAQVSEWIRQNYDLAEGETLFGAVPLWVSMDIYISQRIGCKDLDNTVKSSLDSINRSGIWTDDRQIQQFSDVKKLLCPKGEDRVEVWIGTLTDSSIPQRPES